MAKVKDMRKNYFISRKFQSKFIVEFCILAIIGLAVSAGLLFAYLQYKGTVTTAFVNSRLSIVSTADYILPIVIMVAVITMILVSIATAISVMYLSHRIAGPLFSITKNLKKVAAGDLSFKLRLRSTDEIKNVVDTINETTESIREHILIIKSRSQELDSEIKALTKDSVTVKDIKVKAKMLEEKSSQLNEAVSRFKLK